MLLALVGVVFAETPLTLEEVLRRAQDASEDVRVAEAGLAGSRADVTGARAGLLPEISASTSYNHTFLSEYDDLFAGTGGGFELPFGQDDTWRAGLNVSQPLWTGGRTRAAMELAGGGVEVAELGLASARASTALQAAQAFYDAALTERMVAIAADSVRQAETTLQHATLAHEVGRQPEFEVVRARVELEARRVTLLQQERTRDAAGRRLRRLVDLPPDAPLALAGALDDREEDARVAKVVANVGDGPRAAVAQADEAVALAEASVALTRSQRLPQIYASASYGWVAYPDGPVPPVDPGEWATNATAGAAVSVPLYAGGRYASDDAAARADLAQAEARAQQVHELAALDEADARAALATAADQWAATAGSVDQAERAYAIAEVRFREGLSTQAELSDARLLLEQARTQRARAARDLQLARVRLALLPALPLGQTPAY